MSKYTPGPWRATKHPNWDGNNCVFSGTQQLASCHNDDLSHEEIEANTRLMATAPDLLRCLIWAVKMLEELKVDYSLEPMKAAIAKAEGREE